MKKQIMSIAAAAAILTTGAMAFDYTYDGEIVADITNATLDANGVVTKKYASYVGGVDANSDLNLSVNNKGDALIYPAFRAGTFTLKDGTESGPWSSTMVVRNAEVNATVCKVVLYAEDNSRELLDFNIYLSPYDAFRFKIEENGDITTRDGSFTEIRKSLADDGSQFVKHEEETLTIGNIRSVAGNENVTAGYAVIYAMVEATNEKLKEADSGAVVAVTDPRGAYHGDHTKLFEDFRLTMDICRDYDLTTGAYDYNVSNVVTNWRTGLTVNNSYIQNGTATDFNVTAPNVESACLQNAIAQFSVINDDNVTLNKIAGMASLFTSPSSDLLFGDVTISRGGEDPRNLLISATALDNYTADNQMMLWGDGEYAAMQDRRIVAGEFLATSNTTKGFADTDRTGYSDYNLTEIKDDNEVFVTKRAYYTFDDNKMEGSNTLLITQPMKRAMIMANFGDLYWVDGTTGISAVDSQWGEFNIDFKFYDENENLASGIDSFEVVTSPVSGSAEDAYKNELESVRNSERTEAPGTLFKTSENNGFASMDLGKNSLGLPAIVTQMTGSVVGGESQINWIYSTTNK